MRAWGRADLLVIASCVLAIVCGALNEPPVMRDSIRAVELIESFAIFAILLVMAHRFYYRKRDSWLLPRHAAHLGLGLTLLLVTAGAGVIDRVGEPFKWYGAPVLLPALTLLLLGLIDMVRWLPHRAVAAEILLDRERFYAAVEEVLDDRRK